MTRQNLLGYPVDNPSMPEALSLLEQFIADRTPRYVVAINPNKLWQMQRDSRLAAVVDKASMLIPEKAIVIGAFIVGVPVRHHVGGSMLLERFLPLAERKGYSVYLLGAKRVVLDRLLARLRREYPELRIVGYHDGYLSAEDDKAVSEEISRLRPDVLFVAMGSPRQEFWIADHFRRLGVPVSMGVGGSFDVLSGVKRDAPPWVRTIAMEWFYRLLQDPGNLWKRYLTTMPWFLYRVFRARCAVALGR